MLETHEETYDQAFDESVDEPLLRHRRFKEDSELDITPMIDVTFLLLIFFLVASVPDPDTSVELPPARYGKGVSERTSIILTIGSSGADGGALVYEGDGTGGTRLSDDLAQQEQQIQNWVQAGVAEGKGTILIKAERDVKHREVARVAAAAAAVAQIGLNVAVYESD